MFVVISAHNIVFEFDNGFSLFRNLNLVLNSSFTALVGPNGVGKSHLAQLLAGNLKPTSGNVKRHRPVVLLPQNESPPQITVREYLGENYSWSSLGEEFLTPINKHSMCHHLSGGQWMRVRLAKVIGDSYIILDEPSNDLDREGREVLLRFLRKATQGILLISHDREILSYCDEVLELSNLGLTKYGGGWNKYQEIREREIEQRQFELNSAKLQRDQTRKERTQLIARQEKRIRQGALSAQKGGMPKILIGARKRNAEKTAAKIDSSTQQAVDAKVRHAYTAFSMLKSNPVMYSYLNGKALPLQKPIIEANDFNIRFENWLYPRPLNFSWRGNFRLALSGQNGSGKSSLLKAILGEKFPHSCGQLKVRSVEALYVDQRCSSLIESQTIIENLRSACPGTDTELRNHLAHFLFTGETAFQKIETLSGGEKLRVALAMGFLKSAQPELLILDEPTNNLDLVNIEFLEKLLKNFIGALIIVSHDQVFLKNAGIKEEFNLSHPFDKP